MNKKHSLLLVAVLGILITGFFAYHRFGKFLPTAQSSLDIQPLSDKEIHRIRQQTPISEVKVFKKERSVKLIHAEQVIRSYPMRLGFAPVGHKVQEGDGKTPEGQYVLDWRNPQSAFYKSLHVSYPNAQDKKTAKQLGVSPGGDIMIHGSATTSQVKAMSSLMQYLPRKDWTWGCVAVRNIDMDEIWKLVDDGTVITIYP